MTEKARESTRAALRELYKAMSTATRPKCGACRVPLSCCAHEYCGLVAERAEEFGEPVPTETGHPRLPYMGEHGCVVPPHLRPLCTMHVCSINSIGADPNDPKFTKHYFELRSQIEELEWALADDTN